MVQRTDGADEYGFELIGPVVTERPPVGLPRVDVATRGYVAEEYHLAGTARAFACAAGTEAGVDGRWELELAGTAPYRTRLLVLRPADPAAFNGTVLLNWQNVSAGAEGRAPSGGELYDGGFAWVGVSAQEIGINGFPMGMHLPQAGAGRGFVPEFRALKDQDRDRYRELDHPGDQGSFSIFHDAAAAVGATRGGAADPLGGLPVERVVAVGGSQSAMRLVAYLNGLHAAQPRVDGFVLGVWEGAAPRYEEPGPMSVGVMTRARDDVVEPVIVVNSETEAGPLANIAAADTDTFRIWEVAGAPHGPGRIRRGDTGWTGNPLSLAPLHDAALAAMQRWLVDGVVPPGQPRMDVQPGRPAHIVRDDHGNAVGGIRLPEMAVPLRTYRGSPHWRSRPLPDEVIAELYVDQDDYRRKWDRAVDALAEARVLRPADAAAMKERAPVLESSVGRGDQGGDVLPLHHLPDQ